MSLSYRTAISRLTPAQRISARLATAGHSPQEAREIVAGVINDTYKEAGRIAQRLDITDSNQQWFVEEMTATLIKLKADHPDGFDAIEDWATYICEDIATLEFYTTLPSVWMDSDHHASMSATALNAVARVMGEYRKFNFFDTDEQAFTDRVTKTLADCVEACASYFHSGEEHGSAPELFTEQISQSLLKSSGALLEDIWRMETLRLFAAAEAQPEHVRDEFIVNEAPACIPSIFATFESQLNMLAQSSAALGRRMTMNSRVRPVQGREPVSPGMGVD